MFAPAKTWAVSLRSVERYVRERAIHAEDFTLDEVGKIFGFCESNILNRVVRSGKLLLVRDPINTRYKRALRESVLALLRSLLVQSGSLISAEDWIDDRLNSTEPLLTIPETAERLGLIDNDVRALLRKGELFYIRSPNGDKSFVSPDSVAFYQECEQPVTTAQLACVFGVVSGAIVTWRQKSSFRCPLHQHENLSTMYRWCLVAYVRERANPGVNAARWVRYALDSKRALWLEKTVLSQQIITCSQLAIAASEGRIPAIRTPAGTPVYVAAAVQKEAKRLGRGPLGVLTPTNIQET